MRALIAILAFGLLSPANFAAEKTPSTPPAAQQTKPKFRPFHGTVKSFDKTARTVTLNGAKAQTFAIIAETKINKGGKPTTVEALVAGEKLGGRARQAPDGRWEALTINLKPPSASKSAKGEPKPDTAPDER